LKDRREKYEMAVNPVNAFLNSTVEEGSVASDMITKAAFHEAFKYFCNKHKLAVMSMIQFGKAIKETIKLHEVRETTGKCLTVGLV
jgi:hypothetical protein